MLSEQLLVSWHFTRRGEICSTTELLPNILEGHGCEGICAPFSDSVYTLSWSMLTALASFFFRPTCSGIERWL